jgi:putative tricarboxylic transport membrane protein
MRRFKLSVIVLAALGLLWQVATAVHAEEYPSKQINWYIHSSAGGGTDIFTRVVADQLKDILGVPIVVSSMSGGSGARMLNYMMEQPADGYTIVSLTNSNLATMARKNTTAQREDLVGIARGCYDPQAFMFAPAVSKYKNIEELLAVAKENPGKVKVGITHVASVDHVAAYLLAKAAGVQFEYVPFSGGGEIVVALLGGVVDVGVLNPSEVMGQVEAGNLDAMVVFVEERLDEFKEAPTAKELGYNVEMNTWRGIAVKKGTPEEIVKKLRDAVQQVMQSEKYQKYLADNSMKPSSCMTGEQWDAFMDAEWPLWKEIMVELGYRKES